VPPRDISVTFTPPKRKPTTLQMAVPPMPDSRASSASIERERSIVQRLPTRAERVSDIEISTASGQIETPLPPPATATHASVRRWWPLMLAATLPAIALGAGAAYIYTKGTQTSELDTSSLPIAIAVAAADDGDRIAKIAELQGARDRLAGEVADADRAIAAHRTAHEDVRALRTQMEQRRAELARVRRMAGEVAAAQVVVRPTRDPFANSTRNDTADPAMSPVLAQRLAELERRATQLGNEVRALESLHVGRAERSGEAALAHMIDERDTLAVRLAAQDRALDALRGATDDRVLAQVAYDQLPATGTRVFACRFEMMACRDAGEVVAVRSDEISFDHPYRGMSRGRFVELRLTGASKSDTLFLGAAPRL
jgi:hypothetical protein